MDRGDPARIRVGRPCTIDRGLERRRHRIVGSDIGPGQTGGWHRPRVKLCDDAFPELGVSRRVRDVNAFEHDIGGMESLAVAGDAVLIENSLDVRCSGGDGPYTLWSY